MRRALGSVLVGEVLVRQMSWRELMRPPVISRVWTSVRGVLAHSCGKKEETRVRAVGVGRRIGVLVDIVFFIFVLVSMRMDGFGWLFSWTFQSGSNIVFLEG